MRYVISIIIVLIWSFSFYGSCSKGGKDEGPATPTLPVVQPGASISYWTTSNDGSVLLAQGTAPVSFSTGASSPQTIDVDTTQTFQTIDGFGYTLTSGSATVINSLEREAKMQLLKELFGTGGDGIAVSYLRVSIGASDLSASVYTYDDVAPGETDTSLTKFSLQPDREHVIPLLKEILAINPAIKLLGSPWTPPVWMKDNGKSVGGSLIPKYFPVYAQYFVKYIQQMKAEGIVIDAITPQNEPLHPGNNPSLLMLAADQATFIRDHLGPAFTNAGIKTKIITYDHNCDRPDYPLSILADARARKYVDGSAFHLYAGDISVLSQVHNAYPDKHVYFTEQYTASNSAFGGDLKWHVKNVLIGSMRNWSRIALEWNLANDAQFGPHTPGGCTTCKGALTIGPGVTRNVAYYVIGHASRFVPAGSVRIGSTQSGNLFNVAFKTPAGNKVLIVLNDGSVPATFSIRFNNKQATTALSAGGVGSFVWL